jgi:[acyl-carrier-protein] S-malonyltransferase
MGEALAAMSPAAAEVFARADEILGAPLSELCFRGPAEALNDTSNTQPALLVTSVAAHRVLEAQLRGRVSFVAGHSLGEFSALVAAGALSFEDALLLVRERGRLMKEADEHSPGGMIAVIGLQAAEVERACASAREQTGGYVGIANDNCPGQVVISGDEDSLQAAAELLKEARARRVIRLAVSIAAHSPIMAEAAAEFRLALDRAEFQRPTIPVVVNATARPLDDPQGLREALARQLTSPVRWAESVQWIIEQEVHRFVEVGPKNVLTGLLRRIDRTAEGLTTEQVLAGETWQGDTDGQTS